MQMGAPIWCAHAHEICGSLFGSPAGDGFHLKELFNPPDATLAGATGHFHAAERRTGAAVLTAETDGERYDAVFSAKMKNMIGT